MRTHAPSPGDRIRRAGALAPVKRWTPARKMVLAMAIRDRVVGINEALAAHDLTREEIGSWRAELARITAPQLVAPEKQRA